MPGAAPQRGLRESILLVLGALALYFLISLLSYDSSDAGWSQSARSGAVHNLGGVAGAWFADLFFHLFGYLAYVFPFLVACSAWLLYRDGGVLGGRSGGAWHWALRLTGVVFTLGAGAGLARLYAVNPLALPLDGGGILGEVVATTLSAAFSPVGAALFMGALLLTGISLATGLSWIRVIDNIGRLTLAGFGGLATAWNRGRDKMTARRLRREREQNPRVAKKKEIKKRAAPRIEPVIKQLEPSVRAQKERQVPLFDDVADEGPLPPLALLDPAEPPQNRMSAEALEALSRQVEMKLADFGVEVQVVAVHPGPVITRFELQLAPGVKVARISGLAKDLARALAAISVRIVDAIPGKPVVGLEVPNERREMVRLSELLQSRQYDAAHAPLSLALGKDIGGHPVVVDLARMPHLLVAGTTGSGKSVAVNAMILSILYKSTAEDVRLIMVDPKMLELSVYEGIPHLLAPVVTDMKEAANALRWCVAEMDRRYRLMSALGVRNLAGYNRKVKEAAAKGSPLPDPVAQAAAGAEAPPLVTLPQIVVIIDELADMMMIVGKKVEELIARLAQKARASGIHLVLATQRPSVDVLTGLIKSNIPTRIAFQVSSRIDSRTILDQMGAEQLLGHGDMLYLTPGSGVPSRVHGAFVSDQEVHKVVAYLRKTGVPDYIDEVLAGPADNGDGVTGEAGGDAEADPLYDEAVRIVTESRRASISGVQRRLKIGYNRAARMIEQMERSGVVGPLQSNGMREVLAPPPPEN